MSVVKVSDLLKLYETVERDLRELKETIKRIPEDREYRKSIQESILQEIEKLGNLQKEILLIPINIESKESDSKPMEKYSTPEKPNSKAPEIISTPIQMPKSTKNKTPRRY